MERIYTKTGDSGATSRFGGKRVLKSDPQVEAYGSLDELSSFIRLRRRPWLPAVDACLPTGRNVSIIMSFLAAFLETEHAAASQVLTKRLLRTITRRAERAVVRFFSSQTPDTRYQIPILMYLNRLSDLFFILARVYNKEEETIFA